jgi:tRNA splicing ligase
MFIDMHAAPTLINSLNKFKKIKINAKSEQILVVTRCSLRLRMDPELHKDYARYQRSDELIRRYYSESIEIPTKILQAVPKSSDEHAQAIARGEGKDSTTVGS